MTVKTSSEIRSTGQATLPRVASDADFPASYRPIILAGQGAYTETWKVQNLQTGKLFALKKSKKDLHGLKTVRTLLQNESHVARCANSDFIVEIHDVVDSNSIP